MLHPFVSARRPGDGYGVSRLFFVLSIYFVSTFGQDNGDVRLFGGSSPNRGRVEIYYGGEWGTICDDDFDKNDAKVICRQLGYQRAVRAYTFGGGIGKIWMDSVACTGQEHTLKDCAHDGYEIHDCHHQEDVGVECYRDDSDEGSGEAFGTTKIPLTSYEENSWREYEAGNCTNTCRYSYDGECDDGGPGSLNHVCAYGSDCNDCGTRESESDAIEGDIRLVDGNSENQGRVEIYHNGHWGTVCDDYFGSNEASVICYQLGYRGSATAHTRAHFGRGRGEIWLDDLRCNGSESRLSDCPHTGWGVADCGHYEDAAVTCTETEIGDLSEGEDYYVDYTMPTIPSTSLFLDLITGPGHEGTVSEVSENPVTQAENCTNTCQYSYDGECDDGGSGSLTNACAYGSDCFDCGPRESESELEESSEGEHYYVDYITTTSPITSLLWNLITGPDQEGTGSEVSENPVTQGSNGTNSEPSWWWWLWNTDWK